VVDHGACRDHRKAQSAAEAVDVRHDRLVDPSAEADI
jgi:hypothetical protein